jgi:flagellar biosynthesis protein FlhF
MRLKLFAAPTSAQALQQVRRELGPDAVILGTESLGRGLGVRLTAAVDRLDDWPGSAAAAVPRRREPPASAPDASVPAVLRDRFDFHGLPAALAETLVDIAQSFDAPSPEMALAAACDVRFAFRPLALETPDRPLILIGPPGAGKTTLCAKLLVRARRCGQRPVAITADARRSGAIEQLHAFTRILDLDFVAVDGADALVGAVSKFPSRPILIDTPGLNPYAPEEMAEARALVDAAAGDAALVLPVGGDPLETADVAHAFAGLGAHRLVVTRLDMGRRLGGLLAAADGARLALADASSSPDVAAGFAPISPISLARMLAAPPVSVPPSCEA